MSQLVVFVASLLVIIFAEFQLVSMEPVDGKDCPPDKEWTSCNAFPACQPTCTKPVVTVCPEICTAGCICKDKKKVLDSHGECVDLRDCPKNNSSTNCPSDKYWSKCQGNPSCQPTCTKPNPLCDKRCSAGCVCKNKKVLDLNGKCIDLKDCPQTQKTI